MTQQLALAINLNETYTLEQFNWRKHQVLRQSITSLLHGDNEEVIYLWGPEGSGKSHLLQACCQTIPRHQAAIYIPLKELKSFGPNILEGLEHQQLLCLDDIDCIIHSPHWEESLFHLYNKVMATQGARLLITGTKPIAKLNIKLPDLHSRLISSLNFQLPVLDEMHKIEILKQRALLRGFHLSLPVCQFLLQRCSRSMRHLVQILEQLDEASLSAQRKITIPFVKTVLDL